MWNTQEDSWEQALPSNFPVTMSLVTHAIFLSPKCLSIEQQALWTPTSLHEFVRRIKWEKRTSSCTCAPHQGSSQALGGHAPRREEFPGSQNINPGTRFQEITWQHSLHIWQARMFNSHLLCCFYILVPWGGYCFKEKSIQDLVMKSKHSRQLLSHSPKASITGLLCRTVDRLRPVYLSSMANCPHLPLCGLEFKQLSSWRFLILNP